MDTILNKIREVINKIKRWEENICIDFLTEKFKETLLVNKKTTKATQNKDFPAKDFSLGARLDTYIKRVIIPEEKVKITTKDNQLTKVTSKTNVVRVTDKRRITIAK